MRLAARLLIPAVVLSLGALALLRLSRARPPERPPAREQARPAHEEPRPVLAPGAVRAPDAPLLTVELARARAPLPARFGAPLPSSVEALSREWGPAFPPRGYVVDRLCEGDASMRARFLAAVELSGRSAPPEALASSYGALLRGCRAPALCGWAAARLAQGGLSDGAAAVLRAGLIECGRSEEGERGGRPAAFDAGRPSRRAELVQALGRCAETPHEGDPLAGERCLRRLAGLDRPAAVAAARRVEGLPLPPELSELSASLVRFAGPEALLAHLAAVGLDVPPAGRPEPLCARDALASAGRAASFDAACGEARCQHDRLLRRLAALTGPALHGAELEQEPGGGDPVLIAYLDGWRYSAEALDFGGFFDLDSAVGLLNSLLEERSAAVRLFVLATSSSGVTVVAAPERAARALAGEGLLLLGEASYPMNVGRAARP